MRRLVAFASLLSLFSLPLAAQSIGPLPPLTARVDVNIVNVDVTVTDRHGNPVMNLTKDDFDIFEDGKPMKVTNFYVIQKAIPTNAAATAAAAAKTDAVPDQFRRRIVLLVDNNYIGVVERNAALRTFEKQLDTTYAGDYDWAVASIGRTLTIVQPFTNQKALIREALKRVQHMPTMLAPHDIDRSILSDRTRKQLDFETEGYDYAETMRFQSREQTFRNIAALQNTARGVVELARAHTADEGKKFMILLTGGMEDNTAFTAYEKKNDPHMRMLNDEKAKLLDTIAREANAANFTIHVINARTRGMQAPQHDVENHSSGIDMASANFYQRGGGNDPIDVSDVDSMPLSLALNTGGSYMPSNDVKHSFNLIDAQTSNFYSLGYAPEHNGDRKYHSIKVKVRRSGVMVANRVGYLDLSSDDRLEQMLRARMTFDEKLGELPVEVVKGAARSYETKIVVPFTAALPLDKITLLPRDGGYVGRVHVYLSVFDSNGRNVGFHHQLQEVTLTKEEHDKASSSPFKYTMNVRLAKGAFVVAVTLRDELSNELGSATQNVHL